MWSLMYGRGGEGGKTSKCQEPSKGVCQNT